MARAQPTTLSVPPSTTLPVALADEIPLDFAGMLARVDALVNKDIEAGDATGLDAFNVDTCRSYVVKIFAEMKADPNLDGMMIAKDTRNILAFLRYTKTLAQDEIQTKAVKATKTKENKAKKGGLGALTLNLDTALSLDGLDVNDIANMKF
jgi:hypothetical protein